jgi:hypothetical protein
MSLAIDGSSRLALFTDSLRPQPPDHTAFVRLEAVSFGFASPGARAGEILALT